MAAIARVCPKCGVRIPGAPRFGGMAKHFQTSHPELRFTRYRKKGHSHYKCSDCGAVIPCFHQLIKHQTGRFHLKALSQPVVRAAIDRGARIVEPESKPTTKPVDLIGDFLENLTARVSEINQLRQENSILRQERDGLRGLVAESQEKTKRWCSMITQLQEALAKKD